QNCLLHRGYTMHSHIDEFGYIHMKGRVYDPETMQFISPDPYIQAPENWLNFNCYSYCLNNPFKYTDPSGEFWQAIAVVTGIIKGVVNTIKHGDLEYLATDTWRTVANSFKIEWGLFKGNGVQILSRFTWELPQTIIGYNYTQYRNTVGNVDKVRYFDGATYAINEDSKKNDGVSLGSFININIDHKYDYEEYGKDGDFKPWGNPLFMHEYGHYIQSQRTGWGYLFSHGIPSIISAGNSEFYSRIYDPEINDWRILTTHRINWMEIDANKKAEKYFRKRYGIDWSGNRYYSYPLKKP
ncbi:hypothetical protein D0T53_13415, partial [Dysgonomonas sp. 216]|uniref:RHS repeat-associated core domain-containing protein n=1 Tax=Dysgonomonas sp. 216 TaxID=2302934 RepID=UPI002714AE27